MSADNKSTTSSNTEERIVFIYNHLGNLITKYYLTDLVLEENVNRVVFNINTGNHWLINKVRKNHYYVIWRALANEMDNHADTHCFKANF